LNGRTEQDIASGSEFLACLATSDDHAWRMLYRDYVPMLRKLAVRKCVRDPEDVVQDVMVRFLSALREGRVGADGKCNVGAYLVTLAKNRIVDAFRRDRARCRDLTISFDEFMMPTSAITPRLVEIREEILLREQARARALLAWSGSDRSKAVYKACVLQGRSVGDVAKELGISPNTVSQIKRRGIKMVRRFANVAA